MKALFSTVPELIAITSKTAAASMSRFFHKDEDGATAVEFAMIAAPFFGCIGMVGMSGYMFLAAATLEDGVREAGRQIRVGKVVSNGMSKNGFKEKICSFVSIPKADCLANTVIDVTSAPAIEQLPAGTPHTRGALDGSKSRYDPGVGSDYVMVQAYLPLGTQSGIYKLFGATNEEPFVVSSATVFRSEPF